MNRSFSVVASVLLFHALAIWALQAGLLHRAMAIIVPAELISEFMAAPTPVPAAPLPPPPVPPRQPLPAPQRAVLPPAPQPVAIADNTPAPDAPTGSSTVQAVLPAITAAVSTTAATAAPPAPARLDLPSSDADYLQNPKPAYPGISKRLGEQGRVVVRVLIGADGTAQKAEIRQSSGFDRLDQAALGTVLRWRYLPGKRAGVPEAMWFNVPINFVLE